MVRVLSAAAVAVMAAGSASATTLFFKNQCGHQLDLFNNHEMIPMPPGGTYTRGLPGGWSNQNGMWRHGRSPEATLFEWTMDKGKIWYDLSIIPTKEGGPGPGNCQNFDECKRVTGGTGFNVALQAAPRSNINGINCRVVTCMQDGCDGAYLYPFNDKKKMADCPDNTDFDIIFCPGGPGGPTPPPTPPSTPPPTTPAPTTPEPTTPALTVEDRSIDDLTGGGLNDSSAMNESVQPSPTVEVPTQLPEPETDAPKEDTTAAGEATPAVEANTQSSGEGGDAVGTLFIVLGVVAAAAAAAFIVVIRRKKAALEAAEGKDSLELTTPVGTSAL